MCQSRTIWDTLEGLDGPFNFHESEDRDVDYRGEVLSTAIIMKTMSKLSSIIPKFAISPPSQTYLKRFWPTKASTLSTPKEHSVV